MKGHPTFTGLYDLQDITLLVPGLEVEASSCESITLLTISQSSDHSAWWSGALAHCLVGED